MEDSSLVEPLHNTPSSVEFDIKHSPYSLGLNLNTNRGSSHLSTNGVSSFSGKAGPSGIQGAVEALTSLTQEPHNGGETDSEPWKNCEAKWLQLFHLVEKQCQEQIVAQQEQFHSQVQRIQEEIKNLVKLQSSNASWAPCDGRSLNKQIAPERQMGFFSENSDRNESVLSYPKSEEPDMRQETSTSQPDCTADSSSVSSGYGTLCVSELNICKSTGPPELMEPGEAAAGCCGAPAVQTLSPVDSAKRECFFIHSPEGCGAPSMEDGSIFPGEFEHSFLGESNISEVYSGKTNSCKAVTSWAQKLKQSHLRGTRAEEGCPKSTPGKEPTQTAPAEKSEFAAATQPPAFYLSNPDASPNPWLSDSGAGLTYWKLEGRDLSPSSPGAAGRLAAPAPSTVLASQFNTSNEMKLPSLKDIYHKKQRENKQLPVRGVTSASSPNHPPEVLTLAPALLGKPRQQVSGSLNTLSDRMALTPDSVLEPSMSSHSDMDSFSQASHGASQLSGFPKFPSGTKGLPVDSWKNHAFPRESRSSSTLPSVYTLTSNDISVSSVEEHTVMVTPAPVSQSQLPGTANSVPECISLTSLEDPVILSNVRQTLKEKHARHIADLRAYYESEINCLKQKLEAKEVSAVEDWKKNNQILIDRCSRLDGALKEATGQVRTLENKNNLLERDVSDFRERLSAASSASKILQERIEEMRTSNKEKDNTIVRLKSRLQDLEEAFEDAYKLSDDKEARLKQENKMFHDLLGEYESLGKEHERVKDTLNITENKLLDAQTQISDLKRTISKLEAQVKQVEHENMLSLRHSCRAPARPSRANTLATSDVSRRKWLIPGAEYSIFTGQPLAAQDRTKAHQREESCTVGCRSPPKKDSSPGGSLEDVQMKGERETSDAPIMRALKELEEEKMFKNWGTQTEKEDTSNKVVNPQQTETWEGASPSPERCSQPRQKRSASAPQRASSLPPASRKPSAPTKREIMLTPVTVARSPKRSPKENLSPGFSHLLSKAEGSPIRFDMLLDDLDTVPGSASQRPGRRSQLQSLPLGDAEEKIYSEKAMDTLVTPPSAPELAAGGPRGAPGWAACGQDPPGGCEHTHDLECTTKARTLAETERFFDELTKEKDQIEAALNRMPSPGGRASLQTRLNQEALEERLERVNRELGSVRMTLKKLHVLRTSANL